MQYSLRYAIFLIITACTFGSASSAEKNINGMSFLPLVLSNNLEVLVVHDPRFKKSSAAMAVMVGSLEDPETALGMAHYLEHMLFLGTQKFPQPDEYATYIETHGGWNNAYTSDDLTNYMFEIDHGALEGALQRFSRFFIDPLFNSDFLDREKNAVNNEFQKNLQQDNWRMDRFINTLSIPGHPSSKFSTGSTETLKNVTREDVVKFYNKYYSANTMRLVVMSARPLKEVERWVKSYFKEIPDKKVKRPVYDDFYLNVDTDKRLHFVKSIKDIDELSVIFNVEDDHQYWASKPLSIIGRLIGDEGKGSLLSYLKSKGWVLNLSAETFWRGAGVHVSLTKEGRKEYKQVIDAIFAYIEFVKEKGYPEYLYKDESHIRKIDLDNLEPSSSGNRAAWFARAITDYPVSDFLQQNFLISEYSPEAFQKFMTYYSPSKAHVIISGKNEKTNSRESIFGVEYKSEKWNWRDYKTKTPKGIFAYPEPNKYIPTDFKLVGTGKKIEPPRADKLLVGKSQLMVQTDTSLGIAKSILRLHVYSDVAATPRTKVLTDLFVSAKWEESREWLYPITEARAAFGMSSVRGDQMELNVSGYSQRLLAIFMDGIKNPVTGSRIDQVKMSESLFKDIKDKYKRDMQNIDELVAYSRLSLEAASIADNKGVDWHEYLKAVDSITLADVQKHGADFFKKIYIKAYAYGNVDRDQLQKAVDILYSETQAAALDTKKVVNKDSRFRIVPYGKKYSVAVTGRNNNHAHLAFYRLADWSIKNHAIGLLLDQVISQPYFNELRTNQQLGYVARASFITHAGYVGLSSLIQSSTVDSVKLQEKSDTFLTTFLKQQSEQMTDKVLRPFKDSIVNELLITPNTIGERATQFFVAAGKYEGRFTIREELAKEVKKVKAQEVKDFLKKYFFDSNKGQLVFYYIGKDSLLRTSKLPPEQFDDAHKIKAWDELNPYIQKND